MKLIFQVHTCGYVGRKEDVLAMGTNNHAIVGSQDVKEHIAYLRKHLTLCKEVGVDMVNCHSGHDSWSEAQATEYLVAALAIADELGVPVCMETHRRRLLWNPWQALALMKAVPDMHVTADLSHWVCVCERVFGADSDAEWPEIIGTVADRCRLIHARVGYSEGSQIGHPAALESRYEVEQHMAWWKKIAEARLAAGDEELWVEPEFGAPGYQRCTPFTRKPEGDLWEMNSYMAARVVNMLSGVPGIETAMPAPMAKVLKDCDERAAAAAAVPAAKEASPSPSEAAPFSSSSERGLIAGIALGAVIGAAAVFLLTKRSSN
jgi:alkylhydroperoxidase family enzyme